MGFKANKRDSPEVQLSKTLSYILRHGAAKEGVKVREDGYIRVDDLMAVPKMQKLNVNMDQIRQIVETNDKKRFRLLEEDGVWYIRANQGHTIKVEVELKPLQSIEDFGTGIAVHGTDEKAWDKIKDQGLSRMKRNHIHLASGKPGDEGVISGMRNSSKVFIYIDIEAALKDGIQFFLSENGVILSPGDSSGVIAPKYFLKVEDRSGNSLVNSSP